MRRMALERHLQADANPMVLSPPCPEPGDAYRSHIRAQPGANSMMDILMLAIAAGLFAAGIGYAYVCERL
jgi:hypothetical protein